jgi:sugar diacid utilization regulator
VPSYRARLAEVGASSPAWAVLVAHWDELETTLRADCPTLEAGEWSDRTHHRMAFLLHPIAGMRSAETAEDLVRAYAEVEARPLVRGGGAWSSAQRNLSARARAMGLHSETIRYEYERRRATTEEAA